MPAKNIAAKAIPGSDDRFCFLLRYQTHNPDAGRKDRREVLVKAATPHKSPKAFHGSEPSISSSFNVSQKIRASSRAARLVSHTQRVHQYIIVGRRAHAQEDQIATLSLKHFLAIRKIGRQVRAEKILLMVSRISAENVVYTPVRSKTPAIRYGYSGGSHAVGPVFAPNGSANPCPVARARPMRPISYPKLK